MKMNSIGVVAAAIALCLSIQPASAGSSFINVDTEIVSVQTRIEKLKLQIQALNDATDEMVRQDYSPTSALGAWRDLQSISLDPPRPDIGNPQGIRAFASSLGRMQEELSSELGEENGQLSLLLQSKIEGTN